VSAPWLERDVHPKGPYLTLCLTQDEFECAVLDIKQTAGGAPFVSPSANATTWEFESPTGAACIVCVRGSETRTPTEVAGILVHEAVHVWQFHCENIGERHPGKEQEAYGIQFIAQTLFESFAERMKARP
jgi:hypothetical protein